MEKQAILYLDDEASNLNVFKATFKRDYKVFTTTSPSEAFEIIEKEPIKVVLSDQRMPEISGTEFLKKLLDKHSEVIRIILTAYTDVEIVVGAFNDSKIYRYVTKPWDATELNVTIQNALETYELKSKNKNLVSELKKANTNLEKKVKKRTLELDKANKTKDKLFSIISKELNKPINDLSDYLELMLNFDNAITFESSKKYAKEISNALLETRTQMENLFCWSTLQLGTTEVNIENCIINNYVKHNIETIQYKAIKKRIRLKSNVPKEIINVRADKNMLNFIFRSLLYN
ncbi:MAG: response regulator, partial [Cyclobacteriaceae bacterium]|nr:response regulator [Cyclobacteriaceae bacterium]